MLLLMVLFQLFDVNVVSLAVDVLVSTESLAQVFFFRFRTTPQTQGEIKEESRAEKQTNVNRERHTQRETERERETQHDRSRPTVPSKRGSKQGAW